MKAYPQGNDTTMDTLLTGASEILVQMGLPGLIIGGLALFSKRQMDKLDASQEARMAELKEILTIVAGITEATKDLAEVVKESARGRDRSGA